MFVFIQPLHYGNYNTQLQLQQGIRLQFNANNAINMTYDEPVLLRLVQKSIKLVLNAKGDTIKRVWEHLQRRRPLGNSSSLTVWSAPYWSFIFIQMLKHSLFLNCSLCNLLFQYICGMGQGLLLENLSTDFCHCISPLAMSPDSLLLNI